MSKSKSSKTGLPKRDVGTLADLVEQLEAYTQAERAADDAIRAQWAEVKRLEAENGEILAAVRAKCPEEFARIAANNRAVSDIVGAAREAEESLARDWRDRYTAAVRTALAGVPDRVRDQVDREVADRAAARTSDFAADLDELTAAKVKADQAKAKKTVRHE